MQVTDIKQDIKTIAYDLYRTYWLHTYLSAYEALQIKIDALKETDRIFDDSVYDVLVDVPGRKTKTYDCLDEFLATKYQDHSFMPMLFREDPELITAWKEDLLSNNEDKKPEYSYRIWWCGDFNNCFEVTLDHPITTFEKETFCKEEARRLKEPFIAVRDCRQI